MADDKVINDIATSEAEQTLDAIKDLERIEEEVAQEAEASVEDYDKLGDEQAAAEAAETAGEFEEAKAATENLL